MQTDPEIQDAAYRMVGEEVARKEFQPGPMARAVQEALGRNELIQGLYIKFRCEEIVRQIEKDCEQEKGTIKCPNCGYRGKPISRERGSALLCILLFLVFVIPGFIYLIMYEGCKGVCAKCGRTLVDKL